MNKPLETKVFIKRTAPQTLKKDVDTLLNMSHFEIYEPDKLTLIKINGNYFRNYPGSNTSKWFLNALLLALKQRKFRKIKVIEGDLPLFTADKMIRTTGLIDVLKKHSIPFFSLQNLPNDKLGIPIILKDAQIINTPLLHTHTFAKMSCAIKNLFGLLPKDRRKYHKRLSEKLIEINENIKSFVIVDGTVGLYGGSMRTGIPIKLDLLLAGWNTFAIDRLAAKILGFNINAIPYLKLANNQSLIPPISVIGDYSESNLPKFNFNFQESALTTSSMFLFTNKFTERFFTHPILDFIMHRLRGLYLDFIYYKNRSKRFNGRWIEYQTSFE